MTSIDTGFLAGSGLEVGGALRTRVYSITRGTTKECGRNPYIGLTPTYIQTEDVKNMHKFLKSVILQQKITITASFHWFQALLVKKRLSTNHELFDKVVNLADQTAPLKMTIMFLPTSPPPPPPPQPEITCVP